ncbi:MAG: hypothetical protein PHQ12_01875, partial [Chthoniobacteraceae bacterium]|nr:hypothetical protein [Chthoniobacteraceae bacterium]
MLLLSRAFLATAVAFALLTAAPAALRAQNPAPPAAPAASPTPDSLSELTDALSQDEEKRGKIDAVLRDEEPIAALKARAEALNKRMGDQLAADRETLAANPSLETVEALGASWRDRGEELAGSLKCLRERADRYDAQSKDLANFQKTWGQNAKDDKAAKNGAKAKDAPKASEAVMYPELTPRVAALLKAAKGNETTIQQRRGELPPLLESAQKQEREVERMVATIKEAGPQAFGRLFLTESVPIWSTTLWSKTLWRDSGFNLGAESRAAWAKQCQAVGYYAQGMADTFLLHGFLFVVLLCALFWTRRRVRAWIGDDPSLSRAAQVFETPVSMAIVFSLLAAQGFYPQAPPLLAALGGAAALIPAVLILRRLLDRHLFPVLNAMVVFYLLDQVRRVAVALPIAARFLFLAEMAGGVAFAAWLFGSRRLRALREQNARLAKGMRAGAQIALAVFAVALAANAIGCVDLGNLLGNAALQSACLAVVLY